MFEKNASKRWSRRIVFAFFALFVSGVFVNVPVFAMDVMQSGTIAPPAPHVAVSGASTVPAGTQQGVEVVLANLQASTKLRSPGTILADFVDGKSETAVIVLLQPTAAAKALAAHSKVSARVPAEFAVAGAPTYYNLQDESIKTQLRAAVTETVGRVIDQLGAPGITVTQRFTYQFGFAARVTPDALERIVNSPEVLTVEKDGILYPHLAQGIPLMNATAPRSTYSGTGVSIAICDTGIDTSHPRLGGTSYFPNSKVIGGYDTGDSDPDPRPDSVNGTTHGTECAGVAAGNTGTVGDYIGGVAPDAKLYAIKISTGTTGSANDSAMIAGWEWAVTHKNDDSNNPIMIISTSFGGNRFTSTCDSQSSGMTTAAANAVAAGITIFASSGNDGYCDSMGWPACISYVNSVGAVYDASFGTYHPCINSASCAPTKTATSGCDSGYYATDTSAPDRVTSYSNSVSFLTLFAPSNMAYTTTIVNRGNAPDNDYATDFGGTSAACPYAAGSAAVLQQAAKAKTGSFLTPAQVKTYLVTYGDPITDSKVAVTKPRVNLGNAVNAIASSGGDGQIRVTNGSSYYSITALYIVPSSSGTWGPNQLDSPLSPLGSITFINVAPGTWDLMAVFSNGTNSTYFFTVTGGATTQITARPSGSIKLTNGSSYYSITEVYIASSSSPTWGPNQLSGTVPPRGSFTFTNVPEGTWDIMVVFSNDATSTGSGFTVITRKTTKVKATTPDPGKIKVMNRSKTYSIVELYISLHSSDTWGPNQLDYYIYPRKSLTFINVPAETYDLKAVFSNGTIATTPLDSPFTVWPRKTTTINVNDY